MFFYCCYTFAFVAMVTFKGSIDLNMAFNVVILQPVDTSREHNHIRFIIISVLEPVFPYRGLGFLTSLPRRRPLHSERF